MSASPSLDVLAAARGEGETFTIGAIPDQDPEVLQRLSWHPLHLRLSHSLRSVLAS